MLSKNLNVSKCWNLHNFLWRPGTWPLFCQPWSSFPLRAIGAWSHWTTFVASRAAWKCTARKSFCRRGTFENHTETAMHDHERCCWLSRLFSTVVAFGEEVFGVGGGNTIKDTGQGMKLRRASWPCWGECCVKFVLSPDIYGYFVFFANNGHSSAG